jgi:hypothetical protein
LVPRSLAEVANKLVLGLVIFAASQFLIWLVNLASFDPARKNIYAYGLGLGSFAILFSYYYWKQQRAVSKL